ncbi:MAG: right-handed parallel beta-helix repeat-containing protein [Candidatus Thermoplasmatota archaeon]|nr:right-handed parallel beta-helix repeat-containing protein [Candidatus Thermoplasmatota archaeon]MBU1940283.1 right-handed parallel beta-helix repeat-containing protein [Candidatus Thermoplasmatota archaeon]
MNLRNIAIFFILMTLLSGSTIFTGEGSIVELDPMYTTTGLVLSTTLYVGGDGPGNYSSIQAALDNATEGQIVYVYNNSSPYYENLFITKSLSLIGEDRESTIIDGKNENHVITISADTVKITGFTVQYGGHYWSKIGIKVTGSDTILDDLLIIHNANGIYIQGGYNTTIRNTIITQNVYHAIRLEYTAYNHIYNNIITNNDNGIYLWESMENSIHDNILNNNKWEGIIIGKYSDGNHIYHNDFLGFPVEHAYDLSNNTWDNGYPSGGNYWQDYHGVDENDDGIGDTPYSIRGPSATDNYPLMRPLHYTPPEFDLAISGGIGLTIHIADLRNITLTPLFVRIECNYSYPFRSLLNHNGTGFTHKYDTFISNNEELTYRSMSPVLFGFGTVTVTVIVDTLMTIEKKLVISVFVLPP